MVVSAYLSLLDDWDILKPALSSIIDRVDEIIVVDGAYRWMLPYFSKAERDPTRSLPQVYDVLAELGPKIKIINGVWENEIDKRIAGYDLCAGRFRYRVDADEIFFFDEMALNDFFKSDRPVGQMDMPLYVAPGLVNGVEGASFPRQAFLFDSEKISAIDHLSYLWLVMPESERTYNQPNSDLIFSKPLAFNAHLTHWRPPSSSLSRARFYVMNYMREHKLPSSDFSSLFSKISTTEFDEILIGKPIVVMPPFDTIHCIRTPLNEEQEKEFSYLYTNFLNSLVDKNTNLLTQSRTINHGEDYYLDATFARSLCTDVDGELKFEFSRKILNAKINLFLFFSDRSYNKVIEVPRDIKDNLVHIRLPIQDESASLLRRVLTICIWGEDKKHMKFKIL